MSEYLNIFVDAFIGHYKYFWKTLSNPITDSGMSYFYYLILISLLVWSLELIFPWRKEQRAFRKDFWLDAFYMFFNFFIFNLIVYIALSTVTVEMVKDLLAPLGYEGGHWIDFSVQSQVVQLLVFFLISDFIQWCVHNSLHRVPLFWKFHKLHHSVKEMGFAAHLRFHFGETILYKSSLYIFLSLLFGFKIELAFIIHSFTILVGHLNHANVGWGYGPFGFLFNNPKMHIWHHAKDLPANHQKGANFGITLSLWDYIFRTNYIPHDGKDIELGFEGDEKYPKSFFKQIIQPFRRGK